MVNPFKDINWNPGTTERRNFGRSLLIGFPVIALGLAALGWWRWGGVGRLPWMLGLGGGAAGLLFWLVPAVAKPFYLAWFFAAACIGIVVTNLALAGFFYVVITPVSLAMRLIRRDALKRRLNSGATSYWEEVAPAADEAERYYRQY